MCVCVCVQEAKIERLTKQLQLQQGGIVPSDAAKDQTKYAKVSFESAAAAAAASDDGSISDSGALSSGRSTPRGGMIDRGTLDLILAHQREANERLDKIQADNASRTPWRRFTPSASSARARSRRKRT